MEASSVILLGTAVLLGLRHGIDWDHIAAITDISGSQNSRKESFIYGMSYALGHASVIITFGLLAVIFGIKLPDWVDGIMEPIVGVTLIALGMWLLTTIIINRDNFKMMSRWSLIFKGFRKIKHYLSHRIFKHDHHHSHHIDQNDVVGFKETFGVGMIHGIGAETPTQLLIFITAAGVGGALLGTFLVLSFVLGLLTSNALVTLLSIYGFKNAEKNSKVYVSLGAVSGIFSVAVGVLFLIGKSTLLPAILG